ncbi:MAG: DMT family transporter [Bacteroidales bacterium]|jgi:drug/metabolite transporter (DMT)-like permease|nr:DMT family transporter [Bacteroidales bacterium]
MKKNNASYYVLLFVASSLWGGSFVFTNRLLKSISPISLIFTRQIISSALFIVICLLFFRKDLKIKFKDLKIVFAFSFFEPFLYFIFETYSLKYSDPTVVAIIVATIPLFTALLAIFYFKEQFSKINMLGAIVSILGIGIMLAPSFSSTHFSSTGTALAFGAVICAVCYGFFVRKMAQGYNSAVIITYQNLIGALLFFPLFLFFFNKNQFQAEYIALHNPLNLSYILILSIFCSAIAFMFFFQGIQKMGLGKANTFTNLIPVVTALLSFFIIGEQFPFYKIIGIIVVITGIFLVQKRGKKIQEVNATISGVGD